VTASGGGVASGVASAGQIAAGRTPSPTRSQTVAESAPVPLASTCANPLKDVLRGVRLADPRREVREHLVRRRRRPNTSRSARR
jgi:hypothetical protein